MCYSPTNPSKHTRACPARQRPGSDFIYHLLPLLLQPTPLPLPTRWCLLSMWPCEGLIYWNHRPPRKAGRGRVGGETQGITQQKLTPGLSQPDTNKQQLQKQGTPMPGGREWADYIHRDQAAALSNVNQRSHRDKAWILYMNAGR